MTFKEECAAQDHLWIGWFMSDGLTLPQATDLRMVQEWTWWRYLEERASLAWDREQTAPTVWHNEQAATTTWHNENRAY